MLAARARADRRGVMVVDPTHWDGLPDGHTRAVTLDPPPQPPDTTARAEDDPGLDPLAGLIAARPIAATPVARRALTSYDTAAGITTTGITTTGITTTGITTAGPVEGGDR